MKNIILYCEYIDILAFFSIKYAYYEFDTLYEALNKPIGLCSGIIYIWANDKWNEHNTRGLWSKSHDNIRRLFNSGRHGVL